MKERQLKMELAHARHKAAACRLRLDAEAAAVFGDHDEFWRRMRRAQTHEVLARAFG